MSDSSVKWGGKEGGGEGGTGAVEGEEAVCRRAELARS